MLEALAKKKERSNQNREKLSKADAWVYDAQSLKERNLWSNEKQEELLLAQFMKYRASIFD